MNDNRSQCISYRFGVFVLSARLEVGDVEKYGL